MMPDNQNIEGLIQSSGWVVDPRDSSGDTIYTPAHAFLTGDPVRLRARGACPRRSSTRHVFRDQAHRTDVQAGVSHAEALTGTAIDITDSGDGVFEAIVDWTWRLEAGEPSAVSPVNGVTMADAGDYLETHQRTDRHQGDQNRRQRGAVQQGANPGGAVRERHLEPGGAELPLRVATNRRSQDQLPPLDSSPATRSTVLEAGPLAVRLQASYTLNRPERSSGAWIGLVGADASQDTVTVSPGGYSPVIYNWLPGRGLTLAVHANGGTLPGGLEENTLYYPVFNSYDAALDLVTLKLSETENGPPVDITAGLRRLALSHRNATPARPGPIHRDDHPLRRAEVDSDRRRVGQPGGVPPELPRARVLHAEPGPIPSAPRDLPGLWL